jgi:predicted transcriptional regulator
MHTIQIPQDLEQQLLLLATQQNLPLDRFILQSLQGIVQQQDFDDTPKAEVLAGLRRALEDVKAGRLSPVEELWDEANPSRCSATDLRSSPVCRAQ